MVYMTKLYFLCFFFGISEYSMLSEMAYNLYVANCNPLMYNIAMLPRICFYFMLALDLMRLSGAMIHTGFMLRWNFCCRKAINHYYCDILPLLCSPVPILMKMREFIVVGKDIVAPICIILISYGFILCTIFQIPLRTNAKPLVRAFPICLLFFCFYEQAHLCFPSPPQPMDEEIFPSSFILSWFPWWIP